MIQAHPTPPLLRRMLSFGYEAILLFGVLMLAGLLFAGLTQQRHAMHNRQWLELFLWAVMAVYFVGFWSKSGQTLPMKTWRIRLVDAHYQKVTQKRALLRYALCWLWFLPPIAISYWAEQRQWQPFLWLALWVVGWAMLSFLRKDRQFLHDALAGTRLIDVRGQARGPS